MLHLGLPRSVAALVDALPMGVAEADPRALPQPWNPGATARLPGKRTSKFCACYARVSFDAIDLDPLDRTCQVPIAARDVMKDGNITRQGDTGWLYSTDKNFGLLADAWMETLIRDFGTDHYYQVDGYFNGGGCWLENFLQNSHALECATCAATMRMHTHLIFPTLVHSRNGSVVCRQAAASRCLRICCGGWSWRRAHRSSTGERQPMRLVRSACRHVSSGNVFCSTHGDFFRMLP
jgi:hypothetical protein